MKKKLGLIVNPIAGMGGRVGLKGTDGLEIIRRARELGAQPESPSRAVRALQKLAPLKAEIDLLTYPGEMGENEARQSGFEPVLVGETGADTSSEDTRAAAKAMLEHGVDLILFAGGDGTARDIYAVVGDQVPVLGVPAGVKIHSAVYATTPEAAGELARLYLQGQVDQLRAAEVMDIDEEAFRTGRVSAALYGYLKVPFQERFVQSMKIGSGADETAAVAEIAEFVVDRMEADVFYVIGPGTTTKAILNQLDLESNLLGVDVIRNRELVATDANEAELLGLLEGQASKIVVTVIGGQGYLFGRGNQQISARVIRMVGESNVWVVATHNKLLSLQGKPLLVDTGDEEVNRALRGYTKVTTGYNEAAMVKVE